MRASRRPPRSMRRLRNRAVEVQGLRDLLQTADLVDKSVAAWNELLTHPDFGATPLEFRLASRNDAAKSLWLRFQLMGDEGDLANGIELWRIVVQEEPPDWPRRPQHLDNLASALVLRAELRGEVRDATEAIDILESLRSEGTLDVGSSLAHAFAARAIVAGSLEDLDAAVAAREELLAGMSADQGDEQLSAMHNLSAVLAQRGVRTGSLDDADRAVALAHDAVARTVRTSPRRGGRIHGLGMAHLLSYWLTGGFADLDYAVVALEAAAADPGAQPPSFVAGQLRVLADAYEARYQRSRSPEDLEKAIDVIERALVIGPSSSPDRAQALQTLASCLLARARAPRSQPGRDDVERAVALGREAVRRLPTSSPHYAGALNNLAVAYAQLSVGHGDAEALDQSIELNDEAIRATPDEFPQLPRMLANLADQTRERYRRTGEHADLVRSRDAARRCCERGEATGSPAALREAARWCRWAIELQEWDEAIEAGALGSRLAERLFALQVTRAHREGWLDDTKGLASDYAYGLAQMGRERDAVVASERGRAMVLSEFVARQTAELNHVAALGREDLARDFAMLHTAIEVFDLDASKPAASWDTLARVEWFLAQLESVVAEIRGLPGCDGFLARPSWGEIEEAARAGPLVYLHATAVGGVALALVPAPLPEGGERVMMETVWLPLLTTEAAASRARALVRFRDGTGGPGELSATCGWLWQAVMSPLLERLEGLDTLTLIASGHTASLPFHLASDADREDLRGSRSAIDEVTVTTALNARVFRNRPAAGDPTDLNVVCVADPQPTKLPPLPAARAEADAITELIGGRARLLTGDAATIETVMEALKQADVAHLACHGAADPDEPLESCLLLSHDHHLTLRDLLAVRLPNCRLAVLSACETAVPGARLPDEGLAIPLGFLHAGVDAVVASLWRVPDVGTALVMAGFYDEWRQGATPPLALRRAQQWVRDSTNREKRERFAGLWAASAAQRTRDVVDDDRSFKDPYHWGGFVFIGR